MPMLDDALILDDVLLSDPVNADDPLNHARTAWWLAPDGLDGGRQILDLLQYHPGTLTNGVSWSTDAGPDGSASLLFAPGSTSQVTTSLVPQFTAFTWSVWAKVDPAATGFLTMMACDGSNYILFNIYIGIAFTQGIFLLTADGGNMNFAVANPFDWHRYTLVRRGDGFGGGYYAYVDGAPGGNIASATLGVLNPLTIGYRPDTAGQGFGGQVKDVAIWSRAFSDAEVAADHELSRRGNPGVLNRVGASSLALATGPSFLPAWAAPPCPVIGSGVY